MLDLNLRWLRCQPDPKDRPRRKDKGARLIYLSEDQLKEVEYLIEQSAQGNHVLFDPELIRKALADSDQICGEEEGYSVEHHIERVMGLSSLPEKRAYLDALDPETLQAVIKTYLNIVENMLYEKSEVRH